MLNSKDIIQKLKEKTGTATPAALAEYLSKKYGCEITRQKINQFEKTNGKTVTHLLLIEALDDNDQEAN